MRNETEYKGFIGRTSYGDRVFVEMQFRQNGFLSRFAVSAIGYQANRSLDADCVWAGQCIDEIANVANIGELAEGVTQNDVCELLQLWHSHHMEILDHDTEQRARSLALTFQAADDGQAEDDGIETITEEDAEDMFIDWCDGLDVSDLQWTYGEILRKMDPMGFRMGLREWAANEGIEIA